MSAQAQQFFPLSALFQILNLDGKDKILPVIQSNEHYQEQMQQMQQQLEQMGQQVAQLQNDNMNLKMANEDMEASLASISAKKGQGAGGQANSSAVVNQARNMLGTPVGAEQPM